NTCPAEILEHILDETDAHIDWIDTQCVTTSPIALHKHQTNQQSRALQHLLTFDSFQMIMRRDTKLRIITHTTGWEMRRVLHPARRAVLAAVA
ncbi:hypothetical protein SB766_25320, partial [Pseudomonas sp. SIMBA_077]